ncbi:hypothetical protein BJ742DRAFT_553473 [Cladochytrium replicatum]|nr:hypothetical protein BJ742DRAFT_553473 [Cladochytrium replicatum]
MSLDRPSKLLKEIPSLPRSPAHEPPVPDSAHPSARSESPVSEQQPTTEPHTSGYVPSIRLNRLAVFESAFDKPSAFVDVRVTYFATVYRLHRIMLIQLPLFSRILESQMQREIRASVIGVSPQWGVFSEQGIEHWFTVTIEFGGDPRPTNEGVEVNRLLFDPK